MNAGTGARSGARTRTPLSGPRILSPLRLPISPSGRLAHYRFGPWIDGGPPAPQRFTPAAGVQPQQQRPDWPGVSAVAVSAFFWRRDPESNRARRICNPLHNRFAIAPCDSPHSDKKGKPGLPFRCGAGDESRTRDLNLGKVALYQLSYSRKNLYAACEFCVSLPSLWLFSEARSIYRIQEHSQALVLSNEV